MSDSRYTASPRLFADVAQLDPDDYEPCTSLCEVDFDLDELDKPVAATVTLKEDSVTVGGRKRYRMVVRKAD